MKKFLFFSTVILIIFGAIVYQSPLLRSKLSSILPKSINQQIEVLTSDKLLNKTKPLYKWKNKKGQWVVSDTPPTDDTAYKKMQYDRDSNVIPSKNITGAKD